MFYNSKYYCPKDEESRKYCHVIQKYIAIKPPAIKKYLESFERRISPPSYLSVCLYLSICVSIRMDQLGYNCTAFSEILLCLVSQ